MYTPFVSLLDTDLPTRTAICAISRLPTSRVHALAHHRLKSSPGSEHRRTDSDALALRSFWHSLPALDTRARDRAVAVADHETIWRNIRGTRLSQMGRMRLAVVMSVADDEARSAWFPPV